MDRIDEAVRKIAEERTRFKGGRKEQAVKDEVAEARTRFVRQDAEFAQAVAQADGTLSVGTRGYGAKSRTSANGQASP